MSRKFKNVFFFFRCRRPFHPGGGYQGGDRAGHQPDDVAVHGIVVGRPVSPCIIVEIYKMIAVLNQSSWHYILYEITDILAFCPVNMANTNSCCCTFLLSLSKRLMLSSSIQKMSGISRTLQTQLDGITT